MGLPNVNVNLVAVIVTAIVSFVIGMLWYSPILFGKAWLKAGEFDKKFIQKMHKEKMGRKMVASFVGGLLMACVLSYFVVYASASGFIEGMVVGFWLWLGLIAPVLLGSILWEGRALQYYFINVVYWLVNVAVMGGILTVWR
jgi:hypothetical protein